MCKIVDDVLPIVGAVVGTFIMPGIGTAIGAGLGGFAGNYFQTHNLGSAAGAGLLAGATSYAGSAMGAGAGGGLGSLFGTGAESASTVAPEAFSAGIDTGATAGTTGAMESGLGGAAMFGPSAGTGTALGGSSALGALGGSSLGIAGSDALSGVTANGFTGALGGTTGAGLPGQPGANLAGANAATAPTGTPTMSPSSVTSGASGAPTAPAAPSNPVASLSNTNNSALGLSGGGTTPGAGTPLEASQAAPMPGGPGANPGAAGVLTGGSDATSVAPGAEGSNLSTLYGPTSTAGQSPMGAAISNGADTTGITSGITANPTTLGQGTPGMDLSSIFGGGGGQGGASDIMPWLKLANAGLGAYQQYAQQGAQNRYRNQIDQEFAPNSPYAQQMQETLARQDAAAGRNSQYGTRSVQLAAALAQAHAQALGNSNYYKAATATPGANALNSLFYQFANPQGAQQLQQIGTGAFNGLQSLFGG